MSTTRWRNQDQAIIPSPQDYEDIPALVKLARRVRGRVVEFDWVFSREDLLQMRQAVHEWGSGVRGAYRCFDARVLAAISRALGETNCILHLKEPKNFEGLDCQVACVPDGEGFRLQGHGTFDLVFGYGAVGVQESGEGKFLGPAVRATLATSVGSLGWDLIRLQEDRFQPIRNVMYGFPVGANATKVPPHGGPELPVTVAFQGPFSATDDGGCRFLFTDDLAGRGGIYLWTIPVDGAERPWYVGQTRRGFGERMGEHLACMLSGQYPPQDATDLARGLNTACEGYTLTEWDWPKTLPTLLRRWKTIMPHIMETIRLLRIHVAPLDGDRRLRDRVEGAIGRYYKSHPMPELRNFFAPGLRLPAAVPGDQPVRLLLSSEAPIAGLPLEIVEPH